MASPSALSRLMQIASPISSLHPASRLFAPNPVKLGSLPAPRSEIEEQQCVPPNQDGAAAPRRRSSSSVACPQAIRDEFSEVSIRASGGSLAAAYVAAANFRVANDGDAAILDPIPCFVPESAKHTSIWGNSSSFTRNTSRLVPSEASLNPVPRRQSSAGNLANGMVVLADQSASSLDSHASLLITELGLEEAFYVLDVGTLDRLFLTWQAELPRVVPFYAVKCNPSPVMLSVLEVLGAGFDCASEAEIQQVLSLGVSPDRIIFANPCKMPSHIKFAARTRVAITTFDSVAELDKMQALYPDAKMVLRIQTRDSGARCPLGTKYGALPEEVEPLLAAAAERNLTVVGVSFHVGSGAADASAYHSAIAAAHEIFDTAAAAGRPMNLLDIGGGFTAPRDVNGAASSMSFYDAARAINTALDEFFPVGCGVEVIAEPGRFFAETPSTLVARVYGKRVRGQQREYWINDGLYGSMNCTLYDHAVLSARPLLLHSACSNGPATSSRLGLPNAPFFPHAIGTSNSDNSAESVNRPTFPSTVFGPTCDGLDVVLRDWCLPEMEMGDWLVFPNMGAYTAAAGSSFNGFATSQLQTYLVFSTSADAATASSKSDQALEEEADLRMVQSL